MKTEEKKAELAAVFIEMLNETPLESLHVQDLIQKAGISRSAFYRMFLDKYELTTWIYQRQADSIVQNAPSLDNAGEWTKQLHDYIRAHKTFFRNVASYRGQNSFENFLAEYFAGNILRFRRNAGEPITEDQRFALKAYARICAQTSIDWILNDCRIDDDELLRRVRLCIPECMRPFYE